MRSTMGSSIINTASNTGGKIPYKPVVKNLYVAEKDLRLQK